MVNGADINAPGGEYYGTALQRASAEGHERIVQLLLANGADVNAPGPAFDGTALQLASDRGHEGVMRLLLAKGARDINAQGQYVNEIQQIGPDSDLNP